MRDFYVVPGGGVAWVIRSFEELLAPQNYIKKNVPWNNVSKVKQARTPDEWMNNYPFPAPSYYSLDGSSFPTIITNVSQSLAMLAFLVAAIYASIKSVIAYTQIPTITATILIIPGDWISGWGWISDRSRHLTELNILLLLLIILSMAPCSLWWRMSVSSCWLVPMPYWLS